MAKTNTNVTASDADTDVADSNEAASTKTIAEWVGNETSPRVDGRTARSLSRKDVKDSLVMDITKDLHWGHETNYRVDVSDQPEQFREWLGNQQEFKVTEE